jgi:hypothetical protein
LVAEDFATMATPVKQPFIRRIRKRPAELSITHIFWV